jgi:hypothetical protein
LALATIIRVIASKAIVMTTKVTTMRPKNTLTITKGIVMNTTTRDTTMKVTITPTRVITMRGMIMKVTIMMRMKVIITRDITTMRTRVTTTLMKPRQMLMKDMTTIMDMHMVAIRMKSFSLPKRQRLLV